MDDADEEAWLSEKHTRFLPLMGRYGWRELALRPWTTVWTVVLTAPFVVEAARGKLSDAPLQTIGTAFLAAGAALFGLVLAGLAVLGAFAGGQAFQTFLGSATRRRQTYTEFYWVAAVAVCSLVSTMALLLVSTVATNYAILAVSCGVAAAAFFEALLNALWLVGSIVRLGLYGPVTEQLRPYLNPETSRRTSAER